MNWILCWESHWVITIISQPKIQNKIHCKGNSSRITGKFFFSGKVEFAVLFFRRDCIIPGDVPPRLRFHLFKEMKNNFLDSSYKAVYWMLSWEKLHDCQTCIVSRKVVLVKVYCPDSKIFGAIMQEMSNIKNHFHSNVLHGWRFQ